MSLILQILNADNLINNASEELKAEWLPGVINGEKLLALAITEPHCGTDAGALKTKAVKKGDKYVLNGEKSGISFCAIADAFLIFAKTAPKSISSFLVRSDLPGVTSLQTYKDMGSKSLVRGSIFMEDVEVPAKYLIGREGEQYVKDRHAFGRPLAKFEGVSFPITEHIRKIEAVRTLCYKALWLHDQGLPHTKEAAMCKLLGPQYAVEAIHECLLLHGHYGYTQEFPLEQRLRDVIGMEIGDGTANASKIVISREIFGRDYLPY
ncbi:acyl-CoA dehydrogenase family protein [Desulfallas sp. Bu1-1]|uniref:acyl-CoA dehydrogenase family protein n=1 Tax=Desulfallas sp. Bu1-1 TaxID=2787620 RepID=UPI00189EE73A|nr:acyl-CoA dehydrogenase family protein [Desulfallas sp. Bu1-1]MBF7084309.1 acyl-CoA dehydrogenase family protein [Desulfallas sp. Bu1-1]